MAEGANRLSGPPPTSSLRCLDPISICNFQPHCAYNECPGNSMPDQYASFFGASTAASASFIGLLFVALSIVDRDDADPVERGRRTLLADSSFLVLADIFFVSLGALTGGAIALAGGSLAMSTIGLLAYSWILQRGRRSGYYAPGHPNRKLNLVFAIVTAGSFSVQLALSVGLLLHPQSSALVRALVLVLVLLFATALGRCWEISGIRTR